jgi:hypothetical protein
METKNTFTIMGSGIGFSGGNYKNFEPSDAAKKAGRALFKQLEDPKFRKYKNKTSIRFILRKRDRKSAGKTYAYEVSRTKLKKPIVVKRGNAEYTVKYDYHIKSCSMDATEVKKMTGGCLGCAIGGNRNLRKGGYEGGEGGEGGEDGEGTEGATGTEDTDDTEDTGVTEGNEGNEGNGDTGDTGVTEGNEGNEGNGDTEGNGVTGVTEDVMIGGKKRQSKNAKNAKNAKNVKNAKNAKANKKK